MATRQTKPPVDPIEPQDPDETWQMPVGHGVVPGQLQTFDEEPEPEQTAADRVLSMLSDLGDDDRAFVKVSKVHPGGKLGWCDDYTVTDFEIGGYKMIRRQFGPGEYQVILYGTIPGTKRFSIRTRATVKLDAVQSEGITSATPNGGTSDLGLILQQMQASNEAILRAIVEKPAVDPMAAMKESFAMMTMMREAMGLSGANAEKPKNQLGEIIEAVRMLRDVSDEMSPKAVPEGPMGMVSQMLPLIQSVMASQQKPAQAAPPQLQHNPAPVRIARPAAPLQGIPEPVDSTVNPTPDFQAPESPATQDDPMNPIAILALRGHFATLVLMAKENAPIEDGANLIYEFLPDDMIALMQQDKWFDLLSMLDADLAPHKEWLTKVRDMALGLFADPNDEDDDGPESVTEVVPEVKPV